MTGWGQVIAGINHHDRMGSGQSNRTSSKYSENPRNIYCKGPLYYWLVKRIEVVHPPQKSFSSFFLDIAFNENILDMLYTVSVDCWYHKPHPISLGDVIFRRFQGWSSKLVISSAVSYEDNILRQLSYSTWNFNINNFLGIIIRTSVAHISWYFVSQLSTE